jgi:hypothetical protein
MTLDRCPRCDRAGSAYCAELGRPCVRREAPRPKPRRTYKRRQINVSQYADRKAYWRAYYEAVKHEGWNRRRRATAA